jgi:hypothetical protein
MHHRAEKIQTLWHAAQQCDEWVGSDVLEVLTETRKLLENRNLRQTYPLLYLYCDWSLHDSIDRSDMARRVLRSFFDHLVPPKGVTRLPGDGAASPREYFQRSLALVGPAALRKEWLALHRAFSIDAPQLDSQRHWCRFYMTVLSRIEGTPIELAVTLENGEPRGKKPNVALYKEMSQRTGGDDTLIPTRIEVRPGRDCTAHPELLQEFRKVGADDVIRQTLEAMDTSGCWVVRTTPQIEVWVVIEPDESASAFARP